MKTVRTSLTPLLLAALLGGCAGGGETGTGLISTDPVVSLGSITGFGSVYVNGVHFQTTGSSVSLNGAGANETDLKLGMVVKVRGKIDANDSTLGIASAVEFENELKGAVTAATLDANNIGTITVMGQTINLDSNTLIDGATTIAVNNVVEISGYADGLGNIYATLVDVKKLAYAAGDEIELKGVISNLTTATTFTIASQLVDFTSANINAPLQNGALVEIKSTTGFNAGTLIANRIEVKNINGTEFDGEDGQEIELEGLVTTVDLDNNLIIVNGYTVIVDNPSLFNVGSRIEVKGQFNGDGKLVLKEYESRISSDLEINGLITMDLGNQPNQIVLFNRSFIINNQTIMNDDRDDLGTPPDHYFGISDLNTGNRVEVRAYLNGNNALIVTRLDRINNANPISEPYTIKGIISATDSTTYLTIKDNFTIDISAVAGQLAGKGVNDEVEAEVDASMVAIAIH